MKKLLQEKTDGKLWGEWKESLSDDDDLLREVVGDDKNDKKRKTNLNEEVETELI